jgi:hypothetical protein
VLLDALAPRFLVDMGIRRAELEEMSLVDIMDVLDYLREVGSRAG